MVNYTGRPAERSSFLSPVKFSEKESTLKETAKIRGKKKGKCKEPYDNGFVIPRFNVFLSKTRDFCPKIK
jgi:hypothetical protein